MQEMCELLLHSLLPQVTDALQTCSCKENIKCIYLTCCLTPKHASNQQVYSVAIHN